MRITIKMMTTAEENLAESIENFERACQEIIVSMARQHVATMMARFETRLITDLLAAIDRGDLGLADVLGYVPGAGEIKSGITLRAEWKK